MKWTRAFIKTQSPSGTESGTGLFFVIEASIYTRWLLQLPNTTERLTHLEFIRYITKTYLKNHVNKLNEVVYGGMPCD